MIYTLLILAVAIIHFCFVLFVIAGGLLAFHWPTMIWWHLTCAIYGVAIMLIGWRCPLTDIEVWLRQQRGDVLSERWEFLRHYVWSHLGLDGNEWFITAALVVALLVFNFRAYQSVIFWS
ncbi:MAG: DUF2784 domain-containing protein [Porticoccaceae bacterium]